MPSVGQLCNDANRAAPLTARRSIVVVSDRIDTAPDGPGQDAAPWQGDDAWVDVAGGYLERLPLSLIAAGAYDEVEIWHHAAHPGAAGAVRANARLSYRGFVGDHADNRAMIDFVRCHGAPHLLVIYGLGVSAALLEACAASVILYNSIDAPALRVDDAVARHFDLVLTGAPWQSDAVAARVPGMATAVLPVGPEFAALGQFRPLPVTPDYDLIYVAAAQGYKRHDILFDAVAATGARALCVFGYGERADEYRDEIATRGLPIDCIGPPGVDHDAVNALMNRARIGVVAGVDDGAPAILTEYMLAGLPVLANAELSCGLQYITPETGRAVPAREWPDAIPAMLAERHRFCPRPVALSRWGWPISAARLLDLIQTQQDNRPC